MSALPGEASTSPRTPPEVSRADRVDGLSLQLMSLSGMDAVTSSAQSEEVLELEHVLSADAPTDVATGLYRVILGRRPDVGSDAVEALIHGLSPVRLAVSLLESPEGQNLLPERRAVLTRDLAKRSFREVWGLPICGSLGSYMIDPNLPFILASYRVGLGRPPWPLELDQGRRLLDEGFGRERFLRMIWREPGTPSRVCGPVSRTPRGAIALVLRPRRVSALRAHVLAMETALATQLPSWELDVNPGLIESGSGDENVISSWYLLARINEVAAGVRRLAGDRGW